MAGVLSYSEANLVSDLTTRFILPNIAKLDALANQEFSPELQKKIEATVAQDVATLREKLTTEALPVFEDELVALIRLRLKIFGDIIHKLRASP